MLLGKNRSGGVYEGSYVIPGGGVDDDETKLEALRREMLEETGIDINDATVAELNQAFGEHEKTLRDIGERVLVKMNFYDYRIDIPKPADEIHVIAEDDWAEPQWFELGALATLELSAPTRGTLVKAGILSK